MSAKAAGILFLVLVFFGCINLPHNNQVCPDGSFIDAGAKCPPFKPEILNLEPNDFPSAHLNSSRTNYIEAGGTLKGVVALDYDQRAFVSVSFATPDYKGVEFLGVQNVYPHGEAGLPVQLLGDGVYAYSFKAPVVPGHYVVSVVKSDQKFQKLIDEYKLIVLNKTDEIGAFEKANAFTYWSTIINTSGIDEWNITEKNITSVDDHYEVYIKAKYDICFTDLDDPDLPTTCSKDNTIFGHYIISKKTGQIVG